MKTLSILFEYDPYATGQIRGTLHKVGTFDFVKECYEIYYNQFVYAGFMQMALNLHVVESVPEYEVIKMREYTGYVGRWYEENIIKKVSI